MGNEDVHEQLPVASITAPWLVFEHIDVGFTFSTSHFDNKSSYFLKNTPELDDKIIVASQFDWLILYYLLDDLDDCYSIRLWNPTTSNYIKLPLLHHLEDTPRRETYFLSSPPLNDNSFIFVFFVGVVFVCRCKSVNGDGWLSERIEIEGEGVFVYRAFTLNGTVYCWATDDSSGTKTRLVSIQVITSSDSDSGSNPLSLVINYLPISLPHELFSNILTTSSNHILESCGSIYIAQIGTHNYNWTQNVMVWKLDLELQSIVPVKSIGDRAFFLSYLSNTWSYATKDNYDQLDFSTGGGVQRNCLYFFDVEITHDAVILYSLDDCSTTYLPCPRLRDPYSPNAYWVMPPLPPRRPECSKQSIDHNDNVTPESCILEGTKQGNDELAQSNKAKGDYLTKLPEDLIKLLSKFMHLFDYWNFRCTCKTIQSATSAPGWRTNNLFPLFLVYENDAGSCRVMDPCRYDSRPCVLQLSQQYFGIEFSKNGWLVISDDNRLQFFNPFTRACLNLPPLLSFTKIGFSTDPTCPSCLTVTISRSRDGGVVFNYHRYGDDKWTTRHFDMTQNIEFQAWDGSHVYHSGVFYFLDKVGYLGVLDWTDDEEITWTIHEQPLAQARESHSLYLVNHGQELLAVVIGKLGKYVSVFNFDYQKKTWSKVESLVNHVLFLSPYSSSSISTTDVKMHDRIYLPWIKRKHIIYYSLKTLKYHIDDGRDFACLDFFFIKNPSRCCWI